MIRFATILTALALASTGATSAPHDYDLTFGTQFGRVQLSVGSQVSDMVRLPDGKLLVLGSSFDTARLNENGNLDPTYGTGGISPMPASPNYQSAHALALTADGGSVAVGQYSVGFSGSSLMMVRRLANGAFDNSFGTAGVIIITTFQLEAGIGVIALPGGKFLVHSMYGGSDGGGTVFRFLANGTPDTTFNSTGSSTVPLFGGYAQNGGMAVQPDGKILVATGRMVHSTSYHCQVTRLEANGAWDRTFGLPPPGANVTVQNMYCGSVRALPDGKILVGGSVRWPENAGVMGLAAFRLQANGSLDPTFGTNGLARSRQVGWGAFANAMDIDPAGNVILAGHASRDGSTIMALARFTGSGALDLSFGDRGVLESYPFAMTVLAMPDGRIVVGGGEQAMVARFKGGLGLQPPVLDFDGTRRGDLLYSHADGRHAISLMVGAFPQLTAEIIGAGSGWSVIASGDLDGDGKADLAWRHEDGRAAVFLMNGLVPKATTQLLNAGPWTITRMPDLNGDGKADLLFQHADGTIAAWLMDGTTITAGATLLNGGTTWQVTHVADFDGDGRHDLLLRDAGGRHAIWMMDGLTVRSGQTILEPGGGWTATATPDLNGDGHADILWRRADGTVSAWIMHGTLVASGMALLPAGSGWSVTKTGDFNGDGKTDLFFTHEDGRAALYLMDGLVPIETREILGAGSGWTPRRTVDLDGDGKTDIVWVHEDGRLAVWIMNGTTLLDGTEILGPGSGWSLSPAT